MRGRSLPLSPMRRITCDYLKAAQAIPTVPVQRRMHLADLVRARAAHPERPAWSALFLKAYSLVAAAMPELRRAYVKLLYPQIYEYPLSVANLTIERQHAGEMGIFLAKIKDPARMSLVELSRKVRGLKETRLDTNKEIRQSLWLSRLPWPIRPMLWWLASNLGRQRGNYFGTFTLTVYSSLGAESLHPLTLTTTTLNYGVIDPDGSVNVRIVYDHRVLDGATVARALEKLEQELHGSVLAELRGSAVKSAA